MFWKYRRVKCSPLVARLVVIAKRTTSKACNECKTLVGLELGCVKILGHKRNFF